MHSNRKTPETLTARPGFKWLSRCWLIGGLLITSLLLAKAGADWSVARTSDRSSSQATRTLQLKSKNIEDVRPGERVMAFDFKSETWQPCEVIQRLEREHSGDMVALTITDETIHATGNHPVWVCAGVELDQRPSPEHVSPYQSTTAISGRWVDARDLQVGDELLLASGKSTKVRAIEQTLETKKVFNLEVANLHTYAVGFQGVLVHNRIPDEANVVRGGAKTPGGGSSAEGIRNGTDVTIDQAGKAHKVSVQAGTESVEELSQPIKNKKIGVTTAEEIRKAGGTIEPDPKFPGDKHSLVGDITPEDLSNLLEEQPNPALGKK